MQLRYYDDGERQTGGVFDTRSAAFAHYRNVIEPRLRDEQPELTLAALVDPYLERDAAVVRARTIRTLRERLAYATRAYGDVRLRELERMSGELAGWQARLPRRRALRDRAGAPAGARGGHALGLHEREPGEAGRP